MSNEETVVLLRRIAAAVERMAASSGGSEAASDRELDSKYGNGPVKVVPRDWAGKNYKGCQFSECEPDFLDALAEMYAYFAGRNEESGALTASGKPKAGYDRFSERCARGWAKRLRAHPAPPKASAASAFGEVADSFASDENDPPF